MTCKECEAGLPLVKEPDGSWWHVRFIGDESRIFCEAAAIRAKASAETGGSDVS